MSSQNLGRTSDCPDKAVGIAEGQVDKRLAHVWGHQWNLCYIGYISDLGVAAVYKEGQMTETDEMATAPKIQDLLFLGSAGFEKCSRHFVQYPEGINSCQSAEVKLRTG